MLPVRFISFVHLFESMFYIFLSVLKYHAVLFFFKILFEMYRHVLISRALMFRIVVFGTF